MAQGEREQGCPVRTVGRTKEGGESYKTVKVVLWAPGSRAGTRRSLCAGLRPVHDRVCSWQEQSWHTSVCVAALCSFRAVRAVTSEGRVVTSVRFGCGV